MPRKKTMMSEALKEEIANFFCTQKYFLKKLKKVLKKC